MPAIDLVDTVQTFGVELLLLIISALLSYMVAKVRAWDNRLDRIHTAMFGMEEVDHIDGLVDRMAVHEKGLREEGILPLDEEDEMTVEELMKRMDGSNHSDD